jgi:AcrR family transcriptional regulator
LGYRLRGLRQSTAAHRKATRTGEIVARKSTSSARRSVVRAAAAEPSAAFSPNYLLHERRQAIVKAAAASFNQRGFANTSMDDVASALGVTKPTLYKYYRSKHEILVECHMLALSLTEKAIAESRRGKTGLEKFEIFAHENMRILLGELGSFPVISDVDSLLPADRKRVVRRREAVSTAIRAIMQEGMSDGSMAVKDPNLAVMFVFGVFNWLPVWYRPTGPSSPTQIMECFETMLRQTLRALGERPAEKL